MVNNNTRYCIKGQDSSMYFLQEKAQKIILAEEHVINENII